MSNTLDGKTAIVTGGGRGLGYGIATELAKAGAQIALLEIDAESAEAAAANLGDLGVNARPYMVDVSDSSQVNEAFAAVKNEFGSLDVAVNNAGISRVGPMTVDCTDEDWADSVAVMQTGVFYCMRAAGRIMISQGSGSVINISSIRGFSPNPGRISYCAPKAAVIMMTQVAAGEWGPHGVRINAIAPGFLRTPMWDADVARGEIDEAAHIEAVPARRLGLPSDVGQLAVYLASDSSSYVNGTCITIDGGTTSLPRA
jgi:NAD(P)-dependent dehydrogenase (short-subunit alcohol dehydrogenase family)